MQVSDEPVVLVTGGARRLGAAIVRLLHARGLSIVVHYRSSADEARRLKAELEGVRPGTVAIVSADILAPDAPRALIEAALERFGRLDMLVNNASTFYETPFDTASLAQWDDLIGTNLRSPFFLGQYAAPHLAAHAGAIVNMIDVHAHRPLKDFPIYSVAKAGLAMLTQALARELAPRVRVNGVAPGAILWPEAGAAVLDAAGPDGWGPVLGRPDLPRESSVAAFYLAATRHPAWPLPNQRDLHRPALDQLLGDIDGQGVFRGVSADVLPTWDTTSYESFVTEPSPWGQGVALRALAALSGGHFVPGLPPGSATTGQAGRSPRR